MDLDLSPCPSQGRRMTTNDNIEWRISDGLVLYPEALADMEERAAAIRRSEEHTSELQSLMRISYAVFCLKKKNNSKNINNNSLDIEQSIINRHTTQLHNMVNR